MRQDGKLNSSIEGLIITLSSSMWPYCHCSMGYSFYIQWETSLFGNSNRQFSMTVDSFLDSSVTVSSMWSLEVPHGVKPFIWLTGKDQSLLIKQLRKRGMILNICLGMRKQMTTCFLYYH
ncbi:hypothetical protein AMTRI_Chr10g5700 [Amborella trichopoda]